jgi:peptidoglycan/xylan/chitin deacetylase (PgdA/CDA1 family)
MPLPLLAPLLRTLVSTLDLITGPRLSIVIFHRVLPQPDPLFPGEMDAAQFDALCGQLARCFRVLTLRDAMAAMDEGRLPRRALVITFDDGYADNATIALPILQRHGLKATFFVATGFLDGGRMWNDTVIEALRRTTRPSARLPELGLDELPLHTPTLRRAAIDRVLPVVKYMNLADRERALASLQVALGQPSLPDDLMMTSEQVRQLHAAGMEIGGHTVRHPILRAVSDDEASREILEGRDHLQAILGAPVESFAYPNGGPDKDFDLRHVSIVERLGFRVAVSTARGVVSGHSDRFQLPRFSPWDRSVGRWVLRLASSRISGTTPLLATHRS